MSQLAQAILAKIQPNPNMGLECQGNWPGYAAYGVEVETTIEGQPAMKDTCFFCTEEDMEEYLAYVRYNARVSGLPEVWKLTKYVWDWGPNLIGQVIYH